MLGVSAMMLHHLIVTFKIYLMFVWCASCAAPGAEHRGELQWTWPRRGGKNSSRSVVAWLLTKFCENLIDTYIDHGGANFV